MNRIKYAMVFVSDMRRSIEFYRDKLGLPLKYESPHWSEFATEGITLALHPADAIPPEGSSRGHNPAGSCHLGFVVEDLEAFHQKALASNVRCLAPPKSQDYGGRLAIYADPDGLPISVAETSRPADPATS